MEPDRSARARSVTVWDLVAAASAAAGVAVEAEAARAAGKALVAAGVSAAPGVNVG